MGQFIDKTGHYETLEHGVDYVFDEGFEFLSDMNAQRAVIRQFQTYPANEVEGHATLVRGGSNSAPGSMWALFQPPQVFHNQIPILADLSGGGVGNANFVLQPLIEGN